MTKATENNYLGIAGAAKLNIDTAVGKLAYIAAGSGPAVMLVHGLGATGETWYRSIGPLAERYTVVAPDLVGHGRSEGRRRLTKVEPLVVGVEALREALGIERFAMVGHSLGGLVAARYALDHKDRIAKLTLVDAGGIGREMSWLLRLASVPLVGGLIFLPATLTVRIYGRFVFHPPGEVKVSLLRSLHRSRVNHASAEAVRRAVERSVHRLGPTEDNYLLPRLKDLDIPVHIFWGQEDRLFPVSQVEGIAAAFPGVNVHIFSDVGHWPYAEASEMFNALLLDFLDQGERW